MPRVPLKKIKIIIQSARHISENAQSAGLGGILKQIFFTRTKSKFFFYWGQNQKWPILQGSKDLLTQKKNIKV